MVQGSSCSEESRSSFSGVAGRCLGLTSIALPPYVRIWRAAMRGDESAGIQPAVSVLSITGANIRSNKFAHLEMQMREITPATSADGRDLLPAMHLFARCDEHRL